MATCTLHPLGEDTPSLCPRPSQLNLTNQSATTSVTSSVTNLGTSKLGMDFDSLCAVVAKEMWLVNKVPFPLQKVVVPLNLEPKLSLIFPC
jgi:hypothetical protein